MEVELPDELPESERHTREAGRVSNLSLSHTHCLGVSLSHCAVCCAAEGGLRGDAPVFGLALLIQLLPGF